MNRPIQIELRPVDVARAQGFYSGVFGWSFEKQPGPVEYWGIRTGPDDAPGVHGGMMKTRDAQPHTVCWVEVEHVGQTAKQVERLGGRVVVPPMAVRGVGQLAYCADPDGLVFAIVQCQTAAK